MARALLDTDILSEVFRGKNDTVRRHAETFLSQHGQLTISVLSIEGGATHDSTAV
jgi:predicted nucleic acid-binding protein